MDAADEERARVWRLKAEHVALLAEVRSLEQREQLLTSACAASESQLAERLKALDATNSLNDVLVAAGLEYVEETEAR